MTFYDYTILLQLNCFQQLRNIYQGILYFNKALKERKVSFHVTNCKSTTFSLLLIKIK